MIRFWRGRKHYPICLGIVAAVLSSLEVCHAVLGGEAERQVRVDYHPPHLSVEAFGASLPQVLQAIARTIGFAVVEMGAPRAAFTVSVEDATLEQALRHLLRGENYALLYREQGKREVVGGLETIVLLGPRLSPAATPDPEDRRLEINPDTAITPHEGETTYSGLVSPAARSMLSQYGVQRGAYERSMAEEDSTLKLEELLRVHAVAGLWEFPGEVVSATSSADVNLLWENAAQPTIEDSPGATAMPSLPSDIEETLAIATRLA